MNIDYGALLNSILSSIDESLHDNYDWDVVLKSAKPCWDGTAIEVKSKDFTMVFDCISYELKQYDGSDLL
ncbi:MAG: hypothetical protein J6Y78_12920 [Paludibacteraceae bacterium]|nr:hypothetical protein [Paludibacteraceae bacterium]